MSHGDHVAALPDGFRVVATSAGAPYAAVEDAARHYYGVQFHPEVVHTEWCRSIGNLRLAFAAAAAAGQWRPIASGRLPLFASRLENARVICGLSGGVDSSVAAVLIHEAIGDQLTCVFVDHGLLRAGEAEEVVALFGDHYNIPLVHVDASEMFLAAACRHQRPGTKAQNHWCQLYRSV
jgi:GMP synthase (glutamine-hydrolysing)